MKDFYFPKQLHYIFFTKLIKFYFKFVLNIGLNFWVRCIYNKLIHLLHYNTNQDELHINA